MKSKQKKLIDSCLLKKTFELECDCNEKKLCWVDTYKDMEKYLNDRLVDTESKESREHKQIELLEKLISFF